MIETKKAAFSALKRHGQPVLAQYKIVLFLLLPILASSLGYLFLKSYGKAGAPPFMGRGPKSPAVSVVELKSEPVKMTVSLPGTVVAHAVANVRPQVDGIVEERFFKEGRVIQQGDLLYQIAKAPFEAEYQKAEAMLAQVLANLRLLTAKRERYQYLMSKKSVSIEAYEEIFAQLFSASAAVAAAEAQVEATRINLEYTRVTAPISGYIGKSMVSKGALVTKNQTQSLATITQLEPIYVDLMQTTDEARAIIPRLKNGAELPVELIIPQADDEKPIVGTVAFSEVEVDKENGAIALRAVFPNADHRLLPGLFVRAMIQLDVVQAMKVPQQAVTRDKAGHAMVWVVDEKHVIAPTVITPVKAVGNHWLVIDGLANGTKIMVEGFQKVKPGMLVEPESINLE